MNILKAIYKLTACRIRRHPGPDPRWRRMTGQDRCIRCFKPIRFFMDRWWTDAP